MYKVIGDIANKFVGEDRAMIHSEWVMGSPVETMLSGSILGQMFMVSCVMVRIAERTNQTFETVVEAVKLLESKKGSIDVERGEVVTTDADGIVDQIEERAKAEAEKTYKAKIKRLEKEVERLTVEATAHKAVVNRLQQKVSAVRKEGQLEADELRKTIDKLNHALDNANAEIADLMRCI